MKSTLCESLMIVNGDCDLVFRSFASLSESPSLESLLHQQQKDSAGVKQVRFEICIYTLMGSTHLSI